MLFFQKLSWQAIELLIHWRFPEIQHLSTQDLAVWLKMKDKQMPLLLDARTKEEYQVSHLQNAQLAADRLKSLIDRSSVPNSTLGNGHDAASQQNGVPLTTPIVVYCSVGYRSAKIARQLQSSGYSAVFNLSGSIFQWVNENRLVYRHSRSVDEIHPYQKFWQYLISNQSIQAHYGLEIIMSQLKK